MMKRFYLFALCIVTALGLSANGVEIDGVYYLLDSENYTATVTYPNETAPVWNSAPSTYSGTVIIPDRVTYDGGIYTVNAIGPNAFLGTRLDSIALTVNITSIGSAAFYDHRGIHYLNLPNLTSIGNEAFRYCSSLMKVVIPECISSLGITIFQRCVSMTEITLPQSLKSLPYAFLYACSRLTEVVLPPEITAIPNECFTSCASLRSISLPEGVKSIGYQAFKGNLSLEKFYIPSSVTSLGDEILEGYPQDPYTGGAVPGAPSSSSLRSIFIDCVTPPACTGTYKSPFMRVNKEKVRLFVPKEGLEAYKANESYAGFFKDIYAFGEEVSNPMEITDSSAVITWFPAPGVVEYTVKVYTAGHQIALYTVDGDGHITSSQFFKPSLPAFKKDTTNSSTEYFVISLNNLTANTDYNYTIEGREETNEVIYHSQGSFTTNDPQGLTLHSFDPAPPAAIKLLREGQLFIEQKDRTYNAGGQIIQIHQQQ